MSRRLVYVMGPSGAGKDSVLAWVRARLPVDAPIHWARRTITRPADAGGEKHEAMGPRQFEALVEAGGFAMHWQANGLCYGIRARELEALAHGGWVMVNGSREYFPQALRAFPGLTGLHVTAGSATLERRLLARGRETPDEVRQRVLRAATFLPPPGGIEVFNDGELSLAGRQAWQALSALEGWPAEAAFSPEDA